MMVFENKLLFFLWSRPEIEKISLFKIIIQLLNVEMNYWIKSKYTTWSSIFLGKGIHPSINQKKKIIYSYSKGYIKCSYL